jgi:hypothetical protein
VNLAEIFLAMDKSGLPLPDEKDAKAVKTYFEKVYPDVDFERVYNSDMKKMVKWFSVLKTNNIEIKLTEVPEEEVVIEKPVPAKKEKVAEEKPVKAAVKKKEEKAVVEVTKEAPAKKKAVSGKAEAPAKKKAASKPKKEAEKKETPKKKSTPKKK